MDTKKLAEYIYQTWDKSIVPSLKTFIEIPNKSPLFDPSWREHGYMDKAIKHVISWCAKLEMPNLNIELVQHGDCTPLIYMEIPATDPNNTETILLYGHLDKQPEMEGWDDDLGPWKPVLKDGKLYGRGGADDGYAAYASLTALKALSLQNIPHGRCVIIIEACEESGSYDLPIYIDILKDKIGEPNLVICLDSGCGNYDQLWSTTSLRGLAGGDLSVELISEGVHSGNGSGIIASSFRVLRQLLSRIEDEKTGEILLPELNCDIPKQRIQQAKAAAEVLGDEVYKSFPIYDGVKPNNNKNHELILNRTWRPALSITGMEGIPPISEAGNVLRPKTAVKLSMRVPPTCDVEKANEILKTTLEKDPPYGAKVTFTPETPGPGWNAPALAPWLEKLTEEASIAFFDKPAMYMGEGGSIPFMGMLGEKFPKAQFLITGVLGPHSNAHGPNEFLHIDTGKRLTASVAYVIAKAKN